jgi:GNAT superfamily N-acetyltransferase
MRVAYPRQRDDLLLCWQNGSTVLVASDRRVPPAAKGEAANGQEGKLPQVFGYCQLDPAPWQQTGWISHLVVDRRYRRRGFGTAMLKAAQAWGRQQGLNRLMGAVQTKNYPGISF